MTDENEPDNRLQARKERVFEAKNDVSSKISESCRYVGFGLLAIFYSLKFGDSSLQDIGKSHFWLVIAVGLFGFLAILFDYLQYYFGYRAIDVASKSPNYKYHAKSFNYRAWNFFFDYKQYVVMAGVGVAILLFFADLLPSGFSNPP